jgi:ubiquinol-cytochrome c reductase iron-sulfur subunit
MSDKALDQGKRQFLMAATGVVGGVAAGAAAVPFVASMLPSERAKAAGAPVEVDISQLAPGERMIVEWRGKPVWIMRRTPEMLEQIRKADALVADPQSAHSEQPAYAKNEFRAKKDEIGLMIGLCTHLGCSPQFKSVEARGEMGQDWEGGFYCPCHGSKFDLAGRVFKGVPAPTNLPIPRYEFVSETRILVGEDRKGS